MELLKWTDVDGDQGELREIAPDEGRATAKEKTATLLVGEEADAVFVLKPDAEAIVAWLTEFFSL